MTPEDNKILDLAWKNRQKLVRFRLFRKIQRSYLASAIVVSAAILELNSRSLEKKLTFLASILLARSNNSKKKVSLRKPPGSFLLSISSFLLTAAFFRKVILPLVFDMREEYFEALSQNCIWKARWVRIRGTYSFFAAIGLDRAFAFVSFFVKAWKSVN